MYSMRDPRWSRIRIGLSHLTIGSHGCVLCCAADMLTTPHIRMDPPELNRWLARNNGYTPYARLLWAAINPLGPHFQYARDCRDHPAPVSNILTHITRGHHVFIEVDHTPGGTYQEHWLYARSLLPQDLLISDPWLPYTVNSPIPLLPHYGLPAWDLARVITGYAVYSPASPPTPPNEDPTL